MQKRTKYPVRHHLDEEQHQLRCCFLHALLLRYDQQTHCLARHTKPECDDPTTVGERYTSLEYHASKRSTCSRTVLVRIEYRHFLPLQPLVSPEYLRERTIGQSALAQLPRHHGRRKEPLGRDL
ncbi:Uncharacterised protein [Vibrio cholerae]|nr:Uncharacterised protein [Vibrio cholerae]CSC32490.1 Uncharacterised protein [Vibrio cholerae]CSC71725.1 Uncharacterised protein [Vibrio cholerae]CSC96846.1 Uncharacterised protein [Vibrio cholerae]CSD09878.1 Uncharacterised protein [Vibrio cholerae]